jgi:hypothetical protein
MLISSDGLSNDGYFKARVVRVLRDRGPTVHDRMPVILPTDAETV